MNRTVEENGRAGIRLINRPEPEPIPLVAKRRSADPFECIVRRLTACATPISIGPVLQR